jgi:DNA-directed RNA polymerase specialized sigma24 family protein
MLKVREGTVKSRLFRAREGVKDCLQRAGEAP